MKKQRERDVMEAFVKERPDLGITEFQDSEKPDFLCTAQGVATGIEVTRFFFPTEDLVPPQAFHAYREKFRMELHAEHRQRGLPPLTVSCFMIYDSRMLDARRRLRLIEDLFAFVTGHIPEPGPRIEYRNDDLPEELFANGVSTIAILNCPAITATTWSLPHAAFVPESKSSLIQEIIKAKSEKATEYRKNVAVLWLLIVSGTDGLSSLFDFNGDILTSSYASCFDRLFLFHVFGLYTNSKKLVERRILLVLFGCAGGSGGLESTFGLSLTKMKPCAFA